MGFPTLINCTSLFPFKGLLDGILHFHSHFDRIFCKQTVGTLIRRSVLRRLIWVCNVCLCPTKKTLGLYGLTTLFFQPKGQSPLYDSVEDPNCFKHFNRTFCKQTVGTLIRSSILRCLIWVCTVCLCPTKKDARLIWVNHIILPAQRTKLIIW